MSLLNDITFIVHEAQFKTVGSKWTKTKFPYPYNRIYYITAGKALLKLRDITIDLVPGYVYLLPAFDLVESICEQSMSHYYVHFQAKAIISNLFDCYAPDKMVEATPLTTRLFNIIMDNFRQSSLSAQLNTEGALKLLLAPFFTGIQSNDKNILRFAPVFEYIKTHLAEKIPVQTLAKLMNLDSVYFSNLFCETFGIPPTQYIISKRIQSAQLLLSDKSLSIKEIAFCTGFENEAYFSRLFRQKTELTPSEYRKLENSSEDSMGAGKKKTGQ